MSLKRHINTIQVLFLIVATFMLLFQAFVKWPATTISVVLGSWFYFMIYTVVED